MSGIDWSKIISDAEFAGTLKGNQLPVFYKNITETGYEYHYPDDGGWSGMVGGQPACLPLIPRPTPSWDGEGLPPVGTTCEVWFDDAHLCWHKAKVIYHHTTSETMVAVVLLGRIDEKLLWVDSFRPIHTPEQIAVDERSKVCDKIYGIMLQAEQRTNRSDMAETLYDAGLRFKGEE